MDGTLSKLRPILPLLLLPSLCLALEDYRPSPDALAKAYARADSIGREYSSRVFKTRLEARWLDGGKRFWYRNELPGAQREFLLVETGSGSRMPAFDHARLASALKAASGQDVVATALPFREIEFVSRDTIGFEAFDKAWRCDLKTYAVTQTPRKDRPRPAPNGPWRQDLWEPNPAPVAAPNGQISARIADGQVLVKPKDGAEFAVGAPNAAPVFLSRLYWTPDSKRILAVRVTPGDRKQVYLLESSPREWGPAKLEARVYDRPGDRVDTFAISILDVASKTETPVKADPVDYGDLPWPRWRRDNRHFTYTKMDRGYGRWRLVEVDSVTGESRTLIDDDPATFVDSTQEKIWYLDGSDEIIFRAETDGWGHLYLADGKGGTPKQITRGDWVVRGVEKVDEKARQILFAASGRNAGEDPYQIHYYRIGFDGKGLRELTPAAGHHTIQLSPDGSTLVDTYSTTTQPPVHELRRAADGKLLATLDRADVSALAGTGWRAPEPFVAKGRDGTTDIYGLVYRPSNFDPNLRYPVIEDIYAGPHDSFVPKGFSASSYLQSVAELGFIVVKIDGMGTRNRSKAFHDVCYQNIADAGFPDRILWMKALAAKYPQVDIGRVGIFGTSAGGQSSTGGLLFHPEFYKVAVSSCGCHDNRLDKIWWNEQWMGLMGPHYEAQSNITNAAKLQGKLLLMVGELDDNVPPETTFRLADALIKANKDFDLVVLPGQRHTAGGSYGERKRRDFFVRHLLGVEPPKW